MFVENPVFSCFTVKVQLFMQGRSQHLTRVYVVLSVVTLHIPLLHQLVISPFTRPSILRSLPLIFPTGCTRGGAWERD